MKKSGRLAGIDPEELVAWTMVVAGTPQADEYLHGDLEPTCDNCGRPIKNVFVTASGYKLGGDCLATLSGDDSTRQWTIGAAMKSAGAERIHFDAGSGRILAWISGGKKTYLFDDPTFARLVPSLRKQRAEQYCKKAKALAEALGVPLTGCGSMTANMAKARRKKARPNASAKTVLDFLGGSTKGVYRSYEPLTDEPEEFPLGRFKAVEKYEKDRVEREPEKHVLISDYLIFSDYTGSDVERSNVRMFFKEHGDKAGVYRVYGGYGTDGIAIRLDVADEGILEDLERLDDYPILDEDDVGSVSLELADEAAESYGYGDFEREINKQFGVTILEDSKSQKLRNLFWQAAQDLPEGFAVETGGNVHFDIKRMVEGLSDDALDEAGIEYESDED